MPLQAAELGANVEGLLIAVKSTRDFEAEMAQKFGGGPAQPEAEEVCPHNNIDHAYHWASVKSVTEMCHPLCLCSLRAFQEVVEAEVLEKLECSHPAAGFENWRLVSMSSACLKIVYSI